MKKIALINQRYGLEVNGGSEYYTRLIAEKLSADYEVEVLTTCALDYNTWENHYEEGVCEVNGVPVRRFPVDHPRDEKAFNKFNAGLLSDKNHSLQDEEKWIEMQGPASTSLVRYIEEQEGEYEVFIFVTYLYYLTVRALPLVKDKAILIPTAHDEPYIYFHIFEKIFKSPKAMIYLTEEEKKFVNWKFKNENIPSDIAAVGVDVPENVSGEAFKEKYHLTTDYIVYVGRIDQNKNCHWLFKYFQEYKKRNKETDLKLVLMGKALLEIPKDDDIISLGFVSDEDKYNGIAGAKVLILPSEFESLSISVLEAMSLEVPVLVNADCAVLKGHCTKSNAGLYYRGFFEFEGALNYLLEHEDVYRILCRNGKDYIREYYEWDVIVKKIADVIETVSSH